ncbi:MAG: hypothetical protein QXH59_08875, partial [Candidatus Caldarchaeum sp.]
MRRMRKHLAVLLIILGFALTTVAQASDKIPEVYPHQKIEPTKKDFPGPKVGTRVDKPPVVKPFSRIYVYDPYEVFLKQPKWSKNIGNRTIESSWGTYRFLDNGTVYYTFHEPSGVWHNLSITYMLEPLKYTGNVSYVFQNGTQVVYKVYFEKAVLTVTWVFKGKEPKTTVQVETDIKGYRVYAVVTSYTGVYLDGDGEKSLITFIAGTSAEERYSVVDEGTAYFVKVSERTVKAYFKHNKNFIDPSFYVVAPSTVTVNWSTTGDKTLLQITDNLPTGNKVVLFALGWDSSVQVPALGYLKIMRRSLNLVQEGINRYFNTGGTREKAVMFFAYDANAPANAQYTFIATVTTAASGSTTLHVQGMVILLDGSAFFTTGSNTNIAAGATVNLATVNTNFPAGSKVAILAYVQMGSTSPSTGAVLYDAGNIRIVENTAVVSSTQFRAGTWSNTDPAVGNLSYLSTSTPASPSYSIQVYNSLTVASQAWGEIIAFRVSDGAFLDTGSVALTNGSQVTVGNLSTSLNGEVGVIALAAAETTTVGIIFNTNDVVLQLNNNTTGQVSNKRDWLMELYSGRGSGIYPLFRADTDVSSPSYQVKMTARVAGINGEAKILAFTFLITIAVKYSVASGGNPVQGSILLRYYSSGTLRRIQILTSYQLVHVDPNSVINADFISSGSTSDERWAYSGGDNFTMTVTSSVNLDLLYYNQIRVTLDARTSKPYTSTLSPSNHAKVNTTYLGGVFTWRTWDGALNNTWVDRGGNVRWYQTSSSSTSTHRWATPGSVTLENIQAPSTSLAWFYEQWYVTWSVQAAVNSTATSSTNNFTAYGKQFNGSLSLSPLYQGSPKSDWVDHSSTVYTSTLSSGSNSIRRWIIRDSYTATGSATYVFTAVEEHLAG